MLWNLKERWRKIWANRCLIKQRTKVNGTREWLDALYGLDWLTNKLMLMFKRSKYVQVLSSSTWKLDLKRILKCWGFLKVKNSMVNNSTKAPISIWLKKNGMTFCLSWLYMSSLQESHQQSFWRYSSLIQMKISTSSYASTHQLFWL